MLKQYKILIIAALILIAAAGGWWYFNINGGENNEPEKIAFTTGFVLLDDEKTLISKEAVELSAEARVQFENKVAEIKADLLKTTEKAERLADYNNLAIYETYLGNYREAYNAYLESLKLESQARVTWQNFADVLLKMKAMKSAEMAYKKAIELNKYVQESYIKLADYYKAVGDGVKAEAAYKAGIETIKDSIESDTLILDAYAEWLAGEKRNDDAIKIYQELIVKQPANKAAIERKIEGLKNNF